jgi:hypothetical protein
LEERLNEVMTGFILAAAWKREIAAREQKQADELDREKANRKEQKRLDAANKQRIINFKKGVKHWSQYREMAAFLEAVKESYQKMVDKNEDTGKWIQWAEEYLSDFQTIPEDLIRYEAEVYQEESSNSCQAQASESRVSEKPYNYLKRPWYQRR